MRSTRAAVLALSLACVAPNASGTRPLPVGLTEASARETLRRFALDLQEKRWRDAYALLSSRWRSAYTPSRLAVDWDGAGPLGRDQVDRVLALLAAGAPLAAEGEHLALPVGAGRRALLVPEDGGWRVDALE